ncbi:MAG TPA: MFS transporter [Candidatus Binataceae bacterium]|nr:MFS transporter [Candidatus Binataceae bacterium]
MAAPRSTEPATSQEQGEASDPAKSSATGSMYGRDFWLVFGATFALNSCSNMFALFPLWVVERGGGASAIGAIVATGSLFALLARPYVGWAIDRHGRKATSLRFLVLEVIALALYLPLGSLGWPIYVVRAIHGAVDGVARVALFAMVYDLLPAGRQGEGMSIFSICGMGSAALAPMVGEILIRRLGFDAFFVAAVVLVAIGAMLAARLRDDRPPAHREHHEAPPDVPGYPALLRDHSLQPLWIVTMLFSLAISSRLSFVAPLAYAKGAVSVGGYFFIYSTIGVVTRVAGRRVLDRIGLGRVLLPSLVVLAIGLALIAGTGHYDLLAVAAVIGGIGHGYLYPALSAMVIMRTDTNAMGRSSSIYTSLYDVGTFVGPYVLGVVGAHFGYAQLFIVAGALSGIAAAYFVVVEPHSIRPTQT